MGSYNSQYESYYSTMINKRKNNKSYNFSSNRNHKGFRLDKSFFYRRLIQDLVGVLILFTFVISCKLIVNQSTQIAYNFSKETLNNNYNLSKAITTIKSINLKSLENTVTNWIESIKVRITGTKTIKEKVESNFVVPLSGRITSSFGDRTDTLTGENKMHEGIDIECEIGTEVICPYEGKVKDCGEDEQLGKYILINHGEGIETRYGHLSEIFVKKDEELNIKQVIGKSGNTGKSTAPHLHFEFLNMGESKNPMEYLDFNKS